jgi:predicted ArsR family transcriptional regulator
MEIKPKDEASQQVILLAKRCALLYQVFAEALVDELGEEKGRQAIGKAIRRYGTISGSAVRKGVEEQGLDLFMENYGKIPDLPHTGWVTEQRSIAEDSLEVDVLYCPMAEQWLAGGAAELGRLYCYVDQAKYAAFNPDLECVHEKNVLDGDEKCTIVVRRKK